MDGHGSRDVNFSEALAQLEKGNIDRAIECFTGSVGIDPGYAPAYLNRGSGR